MFIERYGVRYELTPAELLSAYEEQQHVWDVSYCKSKIDSYDDESFQEEYGVSKEEGSSNLDDIAYEMRRQVNKYDLNEDYARDCAFMEVLC